VAPEIGRRRVAVQEHDRIADAHLDVDEVAVQRAEPPPLVPVCRRDGLGHAVHPTAAARRLLATEPCAGGCTSAPAATSTRTGGSASTRPACRRASGCRSTHAT